MKIKPEHYKHMEDTICTVSGEQANNHYQGLKQSLPGKDIEMRFRWDLFYFCMLDRFACTELYKYMNDDHIDTALKSIVKNNPWLKDVTK